MPELQQGNSYTVKCGSTSTEIQLDAVIYGSGSGGPGMGTMGGMNGVNDRRPENGGFGRDFEGERPRGEMGSGPPGDFRR